MGLFYNAPEHTRGSTSYETIPPVRLESSGGVLSTVDMVVQRRDGPRRLRDHDDDDDDDNDDEHASPLRELTCHMRSHTVTCHPTELTFPPLPPAKAGTRLSDPGRMQG